MDNKPIIDGVDVSECEYSSQIDLDVNIICISNFPSKKSGYCKDNTNCLYKQLARKTQECEQKDKDIKYLIKCLDNSFKTQQDSELYWEKERKKLKTEKQQAEQKLEKIREYCNKYPQNSIGFKKNILQILDGVE